MIETNWPAVAVGTQCANTLAWLMASWHFLPATFRVLQRRGSLWDAAGGWAFALGIVMSGYMLRWLVAGHAAVLAMPLLPWWSMLNVASTGVAVGITMTFRVAEASDIQVRARAGLYMWSLVVVSCIAMAWALG